MADPRSLVKVPGTTGIFRRVNPETGHTAYVGLVSVNGVRRKTRQCRTRREAEVCRAELTAELTRLTGPVRATMTLAEFIDRWWPSFHGRTARGIRDETRKEYRKDLELYALPMLGHIPLSDIRRHHVNEFVAALAARGLSRNTIRLAHVPLRMALEAAVEDDLIPRNPASRTVIPRAATTGIQERGPDVLSIDEVRAIIAAMPPHHQLFTRLLIETGLRAGEAAALQWSDIDWEGGHLSVNRAVRDGQIKEPKTANSYRTLPVTNSLLDLLRAHAARPRRTESPWVFSSRAGTPMNHGNYLTRILKPAARSVGLGHANLRGMRTACASILYHQFGMNWHTLQRWLGHNSPMVTFEHYVRAQQAAAPVGGTTLWPEDEAEAEQSEDADPGTPTPQGDHTS